MRCFHACCWCAGPVVFLLGHKPAGADSRAEAFVLGCATCAWRLLRYPMFSSRTELARQTCRVYFVVLSFVVTAASAFHDSCDRSETMMHNKSLPVLRSSTAEG